MQRPPFALSIAAACGVLVLSNACGDDAEASPGERACAAYRDALSGYRQCEPVALPATADPESIQCLTDEERAARDAGVDDLIPLTECTELLERHTDPCVEILRRVDVSSGTTQRDDQAELRTRLRHCASEPVADWTRLDAEPCELWKRAADAYRNCDPGVVPDFDDDATCVSDEQLGDGRSVLACADDLEDRAYSLCTVPLGDERTRCVTDVLAP